MEIQKESKILNLSINLLKKIFLELIESMNDKKELIENTFVSFFKSNLFFLIVFVKIY